MEEDFDNEDSYRDNKDQVDEDIIEMKPVVNDDKQSDEDDDQINMEIDEQIQDSLDRGETIIASNLSKCKNTIDSQNINSEYKRLDFASNNESEKRKSGNKNKIKLPKDENRDTNKEFSKPIMSTALGKTGTSFNMMNEHRRKSHSKLRTMKSFSPRKNFKHNQFAISMDCISNQSSLGFRTEFNNKRKQKISSLRKSLSYLQRAGPGSYNLPNLFGGVISNSNLNNNPRYSIGKEDKDSIKVMDKHQQTANIGKFSPGVGRYSPDISKLKYKSPDARIGREKRFIELKHCLELKKNVPHAYINHESTDADSVSIGKGFTKERRFLHQAKKEQETSLFPSPSHYDSHLYTVVNPIETQ